ncbi:alpha/beta hydrolase family protein [Chitinophaga filiformis]|uniref:Prolyl oligopeptidase family serine peptidase n=1 Tax=Chitinophaga filiformis TaxID=104663 RepID=A0ABY4HW37_CHIFI|nr:prolyl oligopeptidase family serine peptidase [Chitinophaga filiformis]UPK67999.1 prolyl oligopeptidase family serine peptidase [Chitinophaga filiformis]
MKKLFIFIFMLLEATTSLAQKKEMDFNAINTWPNLASYGISNDGKYVWYVVDSGRTGSMLFIKNASGKRKISYSRCYGPEFSNDCKNILFTSEKGIYKIRLYDFKELFIKNARDLKVSENSDWALYNHDNKMKLMNIKDGSERIMDGALECWFDPSGKSLLVKYEDSLCLLNLTNHKSNLVYAGGRIESICFNGLGDQLLFSVVNGDTVTIHKYLSIANKTEQVISNNSPGMRKGTLLSSQGLGFNNTNDIIFFKYKIVKQKPQQDSNLITKYVDIWNYKDRFLQSEQLDKKDEFDADHLYQGVMPLTNKGAAFLFENADTLVHLSMGNEYAVIKTLNNDHEVYWRANEWPSFQLVSLKDGTHTDFLKSYENVHEVQLSPSGKFITWADTSAKAYYCYNIGTGNTISLMGKTDGHGKSLLDKIYLDGWTANDAFVICHDDYDLWQIDPIGVKSAICLTAGYGKLKKINFALIDDQKGLEMKKLNDEVIVAAMEDSSMNNGFYKIRLSSAVQPKKIILEPSLYYFPGIFAENPPRPPLKALSSNVYLIQKQSDRKSLNLVLTNNFVDQVSLTNIHPEEDFIWFHTKLISWTSKYGEPRKGILYIPDNLDTTMKYPLLFNYYEIRSGELRKFLRPDLNAANINIPVYLSKGYLVFVPDIPRKKGHTFENALDIIESAALHLCSNYKWIDKSRMGLQGHSFGGTITNFVATHSKLFAAAQSSSGRSDFISCYGGLGFGGRSLQATIEIFQNNLGYTPWDRPDVYVNNSPIFGAGNAVTPLLIAHGKDDGAVNIGQAIELFTALRRAGKKVWFLQYAAGHLMDGYSKVGTDFILRQQQFFDHYLNGKPAPLWMTEGIPVKLKGIRSGLQLDSLGREP